jgi:hypothetical protein
MYANQFTYAARSRCAGVRCRLDRAYISTNKDRYIAGSNVFLSQQLYVRSFDHCIRRFNRADKSFGFYHSERF